MTLASPTIEQVQTALEGQEAKLASLKDFYESESAIVQANLQKLREWLWKNDTHTADSVVESFVNMRDQRTALKAAYDKEDNMLKERMEQHDAKLLELLDSVGAESFRTPHGTAYIQEKVRSSCSDWPNYWQWITETGRFDGVEKRVGQKMIADMLKEGKDLPPGINVFREREVTVRRS